METDTLFHAFKKMRDQRINILPIDNEEGTFTVGILFLNDLLYLLRQQDYWQLLAKSVGDFIREFNSFDSDDEGFEESLIVNDVEDSQHEATQQSTSKNATSAYSSELSSDEADKNTSFFNNVAFGLSGLQEMAGQEQLEVPMARQARAMSVAV